jgi:KDO2-lipid IV(A) lauroyltransferase
MNLPVRIIAWLLRLAGALPLRALHAIGGALGGLVALFRTREWRVAKRNIELCFPEFDEAAQNQLLRDTLAETGKSSIELAKFWTRADESLARIVRVEGRELVDEAIVQGRGVLIAAPHLGAWELLNLYLSTIAPLTILYRVPQYAPLEALLTRSRTALGAEAVRAEASGVRLLLRRLKEGRLVGILPDQRPKGGEGEDAPFFGHPAKTMTLLSRLASRAGSPVIFGYAERLPRGEGYVVRFSRADDDIANDDPLLAVAALNRSLERCVREYPAQYQWTYKRFSFRKPGSGPDKVYG